MELFLYEKSESGLSVEEMRQALLQSLEGLTLQKVLLLPPDYTRFHSNAGLLTNIYYHVLTDRGVRVDIMPAVGTHQPVSREEAAEMFGDIPYEKFLRHNWRTDVVKLGTVPGEFLKEKTGGLWCDPIDAEVNRLVLDESYDLIISLGQVVPHVVVGMANHAKNLFVGVGGSDMINKSHMVGAVYGPERILGRDHTPVRALFDYAYERFLSHRPILFVLTVCTVPEGRIRTHGLFIGKSRKGLEKAIALAEQTNITHLPKKLQKCVAWLDGAEFKSTWLGNKAVFRTCMAMADGGELVILAPGLHTFGEDATVDALLRKYGYHGRAAIMAAYNDPENSELRNNMAAAAHALQSSVEGRFTVTYAVKKEFIPEVKAMGYNAVDYEEAILRYDPGKLTPGFQSMPDGEEVYYIDAPAIGLWQAD